MEESKRNLKGSERRDEFKRRHKELDGRFYACDADFCLVSKRPPGTVAYLDYKTPWDNVTFSETIQYNEWMQTAPVYIVEASDPTEGPFRILRYLGGDYRPEPPDVNLEVEIDLDDWAEFEKWEHRLRLEYERRGGWSRLRGVGD